jgi:hypothetical protein
MDAFSTILKHIFFSNSTLLEAVNLLNKPIFTQNSNCTLQMFTSVNTILHTVQEVMDRNRSAMFILGM